MKIDGKWKLYDPTSRYVEPGRLRWQEQGVTALITDEKNPEWVETPIDKPAFSQEKRTGQLRQILFATFCSAPCTNNASGSPL